MVLGTLLEHRLHPIHSYGDTSCYLVLAIWLAISARRAREAMLSLNAWGLGSGVLLGFMRLCRKA